MDASVLKSRVDALLATKILTGRVDVAAEVVSGALTVFSAFYGSDSPQVAYLQQLLSNKWSPDAQAKAVQGAVRSLGADIAAGAVGSLRRNLAGSLLADMLQMAKEARTAGSKEVASVLAAASYEDTIRRMGQELAGVEGRPALGEVLVQLKKRGTMQGAQVGIAQSYLRFRNDALHADWAKIEDEAIGAVIAFVESLLAKHFS
jgi:hypothetical protein